MRVETAKEADRDGSRTAGLSCRRLDAALAWLPKLVHEKPTLRNGNSWWLEGVNLPRTDHLRIAMQDLQLDELVVLHGGKECWPMADRVRAVAAGSLVAELDPLG